MGLDVFGKVIGSHEALGASSTCEAFFSGMGTEMALELIGAREALSAKEPIAMEWFFSWKFN